MSYPKEVQYSCLAEFLFQKKSEQKAGTKGISLKKQDIQMMQKLYIDSLAKVYENVRGVYIDLMKCIKPNAFLEIQGISTDMENTENYSQLTEVP